MKKEEKPIKKRLSIALRAKRSKCSLNSLFACCLTLGAVPQPLPPLCHCFPSLAISRHYLPITPFCCLQAPLPPHLLPNSFWILSSSTTWFWTSEIQSPLQPWNVDLLRRAPGTPLAPRPIQGWGQESLWLQRRPSTFNEIAFLPFMLADEMSCMEKMESLMEECVGKVVVPSALGSRKLAITIRARWCLSQHQAPRKQEGAKTVVTNCYFSSLFSHYFLGWEIAFVNHFKIEATSCAAVMICLSFISDGRERTWFWISSINDRFTPPCDERQGREEGGGGGGMGGTEGC